MSTQSDITWIERRPASTYVRESHGYKMVVTPNTQRSVPAEDVAEWFWTVINIKDGERRIAQAVDLAARCMAHLTTDARGVAGTVSEAQEYAEDAVDRLREESK